MSVDQLNFIMNASDSQYDKKVGFYTVKIKKVIAKIK